MASGIPSITVATVPPPPAPVSLAPAPVSSTGSGIRISATRVVTNNHVVEGCKSMRVDGATPGTVVSVDARNDLALIGVAESTAQTATLRSGRPRLGEGLMVAGFPLRGMLSGLNVTSGNLSSLSGLGGDTRMLQLSAPVQPGNSGGPLLDAAGMVIGVVTSKLNAMRVAQGTGDVPQNVNFALNINVLQSFLDANNVDYKTAAPAPALPAADVAGRARGFTVLVECFK